ncbi:tRNA (guanine(9)-N1)-methyltransferase [Cryptococcus deuterogattii 99/473]|uniref:tRNA (guanine(9)-N1)-methyltransferase n=1 Tax=Cryptococcus deuterogattii Ram5 TaxID=1296110 RepID=A0A0D0U544_9TREE|nr:tRNA (guanine(9)-N1)-methyltransferase [Cryptococcus deuterogattii Ram5]KIY56849.1 tRNA (guanine(9)-N1)-methyltransferase [Cryptococcus deuterogattii 99/473]
MDIDEESYLNAGPSALSEISQGGEGDRLQGMSKKAMKRAAKQARLEEIKPLKRAAERERRRQRTAQLAEGYAAGTLSEADKELVERRRRVERERKEAQRRVESGDQANDWLGGVVIDLGFDDLMTDQEIASMAQQLGYLYSSNRTAEKPVRTVIHTTFSPAASPRLWQRMENFNWHKWSRCHWWEQGLETLKSQLDPSTSILCAQPVVNDKAQDEAGVDTKSLLSRLTGPQVPVDLQAGKHKLVYLSADAEDELLSLSEDEIYIIGGIVDRNRHKSLCQGKAEQLGIRTARLPIGTFLEMLPTRKVLTVNQVFDILVKYIHLGDWAAAFEAVIPIRKYAPGRKAKRAKIEAKKDERDEEGDEGTSAEGEETIEVAEKSAEVVPAEVFTDQ